MSNFWDKCPRKLDFFPSKPCALGEKSSNLRNSDNVPCQWYINDKESKFCFWTWTRSRSNAEGLMPTSTQAEMAELLNTSPNKISQSYKEALEILRDFKDLDKLNPL